MICAFFRDLAVSSVTVRPNQLRDHGFSWGAEAGPYGTSLLVVRRPTLG